jgi:hypothetical protein
LKREREICATREEKGRFWIAKRALPCLLLKVISPQEFTMVWYYKGAGMDLG